MSLKYYITLFLLPLIALSQKNTNSFVDEFDENSLWETFEDEEGSGSIENHKYTLLSKSEEGFPHAVEDPYIDWKHDFTIEMEYQQTTFQFQNISGLIWGKEGDTFNGFFLRTNGFYEIVTFDKNNVNKKVKDWTKSEFVKTANHKNKLKLVKSGSIYKFYINNKEVCESPVNNFFDHRNYMGFIVEGKNTIEVEYFKFTQDVKINLTKDYGIPHKKVNLGVNINSRSSELNPIITADGKYLYYVSDNELGNADGNGGGQDVWVSTKASDSTWQKGKTLGYPVNNFATNGVVSVSPDNNILYLNGLYKRNGKPDKSVGFSYSKKVSGGWSKPKPIKIKNFYNLSQFQEACFGPNNKTMILTALRKDSYGGNDLYVSFKVDQENWSEPVNMGATLNTDYDESSPFLASDGKTLYFSTAGHPGYGDMDIFVTKRLDDSWTNWSTPLNLGPSINTLAFDAYFTVSAKGDNAFFVTSLDGYGAEDIVRVQLSSEARPDPVVIVHGRVLDARTKLPLSASIIYEELPKGTDLGTAITDPTTGEFKIVLPYEKMYGIFVDKEGYLSQNDNIDLVNITEYREIEKDIYLVPIDIGEKLIMHNIFFEQGTPNILPSSNPELDRLIELLNKSPKMEIEIGGHTDNVGDDGKNLVLSEKRAIVIKEYLVNKGILEKRVSTKGYGDTQPIASNLKEDTRKLNRRVEVKILKK